MNLKQLLTMVVLSGAPETATADPTPCADCEPDGEALGKALGEMRPIDATQVVTTWALSDNPRRRLAVARALAHVSPLGKRTVVAHLALDPDPEVRAAIHQLTTNT